MKKVIVLDGGVLTHRSIFAYGNTRLMQLEGKLSKDSFIMPATYHYMNTCLSVLKKIGINRDDLVIIARDGKNSWRKAFMLEYKAQRKAQRQSYKHINWDKEFKALNELEQNLNDSTNWHFLLLQNNFNYSDLCLTEEGQKFKLTELKNHEWDKEFGIEADDIQAVCATTFPDKEVILVTIDEDLDQLCYYKNVKIFNPNTKFKSIKGCYKTGQEPMKLLEKKIRLGDKSDNIIVDKKTDTPLKAEIRRLIINLLKVPSFVEHKVSHILSDLPKKETDYSNLPFPNSLGTKEKFDLIYNKDKVISFDDAVKSNEKKEAKKVKKRKETYEKKKVLKKKQKEESFR